MVPADWYNDLQRTKEVRDRIKLRNRPGVVETATHPGMFGGRNSYIFVGVSKKQAQKDGKSVADAKANIPERVDGVKVKVKEVGNPTTAASCSGYTTSADQGSIVPRGVQVETAYDSFGTLAGIIYSEDDFGHRPHFITCQHLWYGDGGDDEYLYHPYESDGAIGKNEWVDCKYDYAISGPVNGHTPSQGIIGTDINITGYYTQVGVEGLAANGEYASKVGNTTCFTEGQIRSADGYMGYVNGGCGNKGSQVKWGCCGDVKPGDSGSLAYYQWGDSEAWALSLCSGHDPLANDRVYGTGAYQIANGSIYTWY